MTTIETTTTNETTQYPRLDQVRQAFRKERRPLNAAAVASALGVSMPTAYKDLARLQDLGEVTKDGALYSLATPPLGNGNGDGAHESAEVAAGSRLSARDRDQQVLALLAKRGPLTKAELAKTLGVSVSLAYITLTRLVRSTRVEVQRGAGKALRYGLTSTASGAEVQRTAPEQSEDEAPAPAPPLQPAAVKADRVEVVARGSAAELAIELGTPGNILANIVLRFYTA